MAPLDPAFTYSNVGAYISLSLVVSIFATLFYLICHTLFRAYRSIPIAHRTRTHDAHRRASTLTFVALAILSLAVNLYTFGEVMVDSYRNWASEHKQAFPVDVWTTPVWYPRVNSKDLQLGAWMQDNDLKDCARILAGSWRDYWWQQQHAMGTAVWTIFLAIEGRRRNIPYIWTLLPIAHVLGLSVAQNLFHLALLFTPVPLVVEPSTAAANHGFTSLLKLRLQVFGDIHSRPHTWVPKPIVYLTPLAISLLCTALLPYGIGTPLQDVFLNAPQVLCYLTLLLTNTAILPKSFGTHHRSIHAAHASTTPVFRTAALFSFVLYAVSTALAVMSNTPPAQRTLRDMIFNNDPELSLATLERYRLAVSRTIGALSDHPIVQRIGWDVLLSSLSLCIWTAMRGLEVHDILSSIGVSSVLGVSKAKRSSRTSRATPRRSSKSSKAEGTTTAVASSSTQQDKTSGNKSSTAKPAPSKRASASTATEANADLDKEDTPPITRSHDKDPDKEDTPPITRSHKPAPAAAKPKRSRKRAPSPPSSSGFSSYDEVEVPSGAEETPAPRTRTPTRATKRGVEHEDERVPADAADGAESAALAWGLCVIGGLGVGMTGVVGAEAT